MLWASLSAARGPGEYCRHGRSGRPKTLTRRAHTKQPLPAAEPPARPPEHLRDDESPPPVPSHPNLALFLIPFFTPPSGMCAITATVSDVPTYVYAAVCV